MTKKMIPKTEVKEIPNLERWKMGNAQVLEHVKYSYECPLCYSQYESQHQAEECLAKGVENIVLEPGFVIVKQETVNFTGPGEIHIVDGPPIKPERKGHKIVYPVLSSSPYSCEFSVHHSNRDSDMQIFMESLSSGEYHLPNKKEIAEIEAKAKESIKSFLKKHPPIAFFRYTEDEDYFYQHGGGPAIRYAKRIPALHTRLPKYLLKEFHIKQGEK